MPKVEISCNHSQIFWKVLFFNRNKIQRFLKLFQSKSKFEKHTKTVFQSTYRHLLWSLCTKFLVNISNTLEDIAKKCWNTGTVTF